MHEQAVVERLGRIDARADLIAHLQCALELEHATLPVYLCALYSLDEARNEAAAEVLTSVFVEEMLHLTLAANLLNAVGGAPVLDHPRLLPGYPRTLPHGDRFFEMSLLPFGRDALAQLSRVELPTESDTPEIDEGYITIGQFYAAIRHGLLGLSAELGDALFCGDPSRQVTSTFHYGGSGRIIAVTNLAGALAALEEIVDQGEGTSPVDLWDGDRDMFHVERDEVGHYYRIEELVRGRRYVRGDTPASGPSGDRIEVDWDGVHPMQRDPRRSSIATVRSAQERFDAAYCALLSLLERALNGQPDLLDQGVGEMYRLKRMAQELMAMPTEDGRSTAGPTFLYEPDGPDWGVPRRR